MIAIKANAIAYSTGRRFLQYGTVQAGIYWIYACLFLRLLKMPRNAVFSRVYGLLPKRQMYRNLSQIGVISYWNGVVNGVDPHVLAGWRVHGFFIFENIKILKFRKRRWKEVFCGSPPFLYTISIFLKMHNVVASCTTLS